MRAVLGCRLVLQSGQAGVVERPVGVNEPDCRGVGIAAVTAAPDELQSGPFSGRPRCAVVFEQVRDHRLMWPHSMGRMYSGLAQFGRDSATMHAGIESIVEIPPRRVGRPGAATDPRDGAGRRVTDGSRRRTTQ